MRGIVGRQEFGGVHLEPQHVADRIGIFGAVEAVHPGRSEIGEGAAVQFLFHIADHGFHYRPIRTPHAGRRHHSSAQLAHHHLPDLGVLAHLGDVELIEHQSSSFQALIVANDAILIEKGALGSCPSDG